MLTAALLAALPHLACPLCGSPFIIGETALTCDQRHSYDIARAGYVNFVAGRNIGTGDSAAMVLAREQFLTGGWFDPIAEEICNLVPRAPHLVVDLAGGTGHHLARVLEGTGGRLGICLDLSTAALKRAARRHPAIAAFGADVWQRLPLADASADLLLSVFGPRNPDEVRRLITPAGRLVVVTPTASHLAELRGPLGLIGMAADKPGRLDATLVGMTLLDRITVEFTVDLEAPDLVAVVMMGPNARHLAAPDVLVSAADLHPPTAVTVSTQLSVYRLS